MPGTWRVPNHDVPICQDCQRDLSFIGSWTVRGLWGYNEIRTYECAIHGPIFFSPQIPIGHGPDSVPDKGPRDDGDRDSLISAPRKPTPTPKTDTIAIPEPDSD